MKRCFVLILVLFGISLLTAEERLNFDYAGGYEVSSSYFMAEVDSVLNLYSYSEAAGLMRIEKRSYSAHSSQVVSQVIWEQAIPATLTGPLHWHKGERIYDKLWVYIYHTDWLGAISIDAEGVAQLYQMNVPGLSANTSPSGFHHFGEGHFYYLGYQTLNHWDINTSETCTVIQLPYSWINLERLGNEFLLLSGYSFSHPSYTYLVDNSHTLIQTSLQHYRFYDVYRMQDGLYWFRFWEGSGAESYGSCTLLIENGEASIGIWSQYDSMYDGYSQYKPILRLPNSRYLCDYYFSNPSEDFHQFKIVQHNVNNSFGIYTGFPTTNVQARVLWATYFQDKLLMLGWQYPGFFAKMADLDSLAWIPVGFSSIPTINSRVYNNDEALWFLYPAGNGTATIQIYRGAFFVDNDDPLVPKPADVTLWPNPARSKDQIKLQSEFPISSVALYNLRGQKLCDLSQFSSMTNEFTLPELPAGIYLLRITDASQRTVRKKVVIRD